VGGRVVGRSAGSGTGRVLTAWLVAQVLGIALPRLLGRVELVEQGRYGVRVGAAVRTVGGVGSGQRGDLTPVRAGLDDAGRAPHVGVLDSAVQLNVLHRGLPGHQGDVVVLAEVARAVVVLQQHALRRQGLPEVAVLVEARERRVVRLVLQDDQ